MAHTHGALRAVGAQPAHAATPVVAALNPVALGQAHVFAQPGHARQILRAVATHAATPIGAALLVEAVGGAAVALPAHARGPVGAQPAQSAAPVEPAHAVLAVRHADLLAGILHVGGRLGDRDVVAFVLGVCGNVEPGPGRRKTDARRAVTGPAATTALNRQETDEKCHKQDQKPGPVSGDHDWLPGPAPAGRPRDRGLSARSCGPGSAPPAIRGGCLWSYPENASKGPTHSA